MAFVEDILGSKTEIHLVTTQDIRDFAVRNMWRGLLLSEQHTGKKIKYEQKVKLVQQACVELGEPVGDKTIERLITGVRL